MHFDDGTAKIDAAIHALMESLHKCWGHFHLLQGLHAGSKANPEAVTEHNRVLLQIWRAAFEALFAAAGTLLDQTKGTASIRTVITLVRRHCTAEVKSILPDIEARLGEKTGNLQKIREWRHNSIAHWTEQGRDVSFYERNKLNVVEVEGALEDIESIINELSFHATAVHNTVRPASAHLVEEASFLMKSLAAATAIE